MAFVVGNIPYDATEEQLVHICEEVGPVVSFRYALFFFFFNLLLILVLYRMSLPCSKLQTPLDLISIFLFLVVRLVLDRETGKPKGYGFCEFRDEETALSARRNLQGYEINGRQLRVDFAENEKGGGGGERNRDQVLLPHPSVLQVQC